MDHQQCGLCGSPAVMLPPAQSGLFLHCRDCDLVFAPRSRHLPVDQQKARYLRHQNTIDQPGYVEMLNRSITLLQQYAGDVRRVLDYGCGPAPVLVELLERAGYDAIGYDPLFFPGTISGAIAAGRTAGAPAQGHPTPPQTFDAVVSVETFEHFADPRRELQRIVSLLRPDGYLLIMTRFHSGPDSIIDSWYARDPTHVAFYSARTLKWISTRFPLAVLHHDDESLALLQRIEAKPPA